MPYGYRGKKCRLRDLNPVFGFNRVEYSTHAANLLTLKL
jgi:hypothetical protein